ncbi:MAG: hypothetical protein ACRDT6_27300 [Micromonosporaceae bacterium]
MRGLTIPGTPIGPAPDHVPSDPQIAGARRTLAQHRRQRYPHGRSCGWCRESYPCPPRRDAERLLRAAGLAPSPKAAELATVPGLSRRQRRDQGTVTQAQLMLLNTGH